MDKVSRDIGPVIFCLLFAKSPQTCSPLAKDNLLSLAFLAEGESQPPALYLFYPNQYFPMLKKLIFSLLSLFCVFALNAQVLWSEIPENTILQKGERRIVPQVYRTVRLDQTLLQPLLAAAPERFTQAAAKGNDLPILTLPMPDGSTSRFRLTESPVMAPELQAQFPDIRCYTGQGIDDPTAKVKCDLTPHGFHAMIISALHSSVFIDPYSQGDTENYVVYFKKDYLKKSDDAPFVCATPDEDWQEIPTGDAAPKAQGDCQIRRYRLALACTGEYAVFHGGTTVLALAAMNTTMNRVNGVYENDFAITMQLIANNTQIIYLNGGSDPYSNGNASSMLTENQSNVTNVIGSANFDIGHVFGTNSGGVAGLSVVCSNNSKARGVTGSGAPIGDPFDIDYVAHEMGHQFGGPHSFNGNAGSCNGNGSANNAVEPGSGTTIMAYAGICGAQDVQPNSDDYFHANSIQRITAFAINGNGNNCPVKIASGNNNPTVDGGPDYIIPKSTPFALTATGSDVDGDTLTYCWEQIDAALGTPNPPAPTNATGPLFRSFKGTVVPTRWFPRLSDLVSNTNYPWEELPGVARTMNFRVVVRDNNDGAGCTDEDDVSLTVTGTAGPFVVTEPNTNVLWYVGENRTVTWDVSNTDVAPVNCANVRILLSTNGGFTYPVVLANNVPNTGSANIVVPNNISTNCRVKVEAIGNIFFDISNQNFRIQLPPVPTFSLGASVNSVQACAGDTVAFTVDVTPILNFSDPVDISISGAPAGASVAIDPNPATPGNAVGVHISGLTPDMAGNYTLTVQGTSGSINQTATVQMNLLPGAPAMSEAVSPTDGATGQPLNANLVWNAIPFTENYVVEVATSPSFDAGAIVLAYSGANANVQTPVLQGGTAYYWRIKTQNDCGESDYSPTYAFQTGNLVCNQIFNSTDVPKTIDGNSINTVESILNVPDDKSIADVDVTLIANHSWVGDLDARLATPSGDTVSLFDRPGVPASQFGCGGDNLTLIFNDGTTQTAAMLEATCNSVNPALLGEFQPISPLAALNGKNAKGDWKVLVRDNYADDGGSLFAWGLTFCFAGDIPPGTMENNLPLTVAAGSSGTIENANLSFSFSGGAAQTAYTLLSLPQHGTLTLNGAPLALGGTFTQDDIDFNLLEYTHNGDVATADDFQFDVLDLDNFAWLHNETFNIIIVQNNLSASAALTQTILCHDEATGQITVTASGLDGQYEYSLNGGPSQASNVFSGLTAGTYTVIVTGQLGFTATTNPVTLDNPPALTASTSVAGDEVTVTATGGTGTLEYSLDGTNFQASNVFENLDNGIYTFTVRDANGCTATAQAIVAVNTLLATLEVQTGISCFGGSNGAVTVTVGGGQAPLEFSLNGGAFQASNTFTGLSAGAYTVVVKDNQGFTATTNAVTLTAPPAISASASANLNVVTVTASGGTGTLEYSLNGTNFQASNTFGGLANGDYTVTVRDANGCTATAQVNVNVAPLAVVSTNVSGDILCFGDATATVEVSATGGIPPYDYALDGGSYQSSNTFNGVGGGAHFVTVRDAQGTEVQSNAFFIQQPTLLVASADVNGNDVQFLAAGGTPPYSFQYNGPFPPVNLPNGNYTLLVTDGNGCTDTAAFSINLPVLTASVQTVSTDYCVPSTTIEIIASGGEGPYEYSLNGGVFQSNNTFTLFSGQNNVRVRDVTGTIVQIPVNVSFPPLLQASATTSGDSIVASGQFGASPYEYSLDGVNFQPSNIFPGLPNGTYTVTVKDANGCTDTATVIINIIGIVEATATWGLIIAPNPSAGLFLLSMQQAPAVLRAEVFDAAGRRIRSLDFSPAAGQFSATLDLQDAPQGVYVLRLTDGTNWGSVRLSVVR
ncbi:MAG: T9SS C-terminal target domain-containing protein [Haliscomenobacteraceae bacterium CHB4]|nr:T9SS C-terminal target domain-containing protein [Haliscomenobacteraceae bacterium CHB4]